MKQYKKQTHYFLFWINGHIRPSWQDWYIHIGLQWRRGKKDSRVDFCRAIGISFQMPILLRFDHYIDDYGWAGTHERRSGHVEKFLNRATKGASPKSIACIEIEVTEGEGLDGT